MKHRSPKLLYFSLIKKNVTSFWDWIDKNEYKYIKNAMFRQVDVPNSFLHAADLQFFLNQYDDNLQSLHVIIDYDTIKEVEDKEIIRNIIVEFPEVQFLFDKQNSLETGVSSFLFSDEDFKKNISSLEDNKKENLTNRWKEILNNVDFSLIEIRPRDPKCDYDTSIVFARIINGYDNTFDASNLRYAIKFWEYLRLKVHNNRNFCKIQESRFKKLAICVEEETKQNIFNSYALYANGYRVLPITTKQELEIVNNKDFQLPEEGIIIRDFDLQFGDENQSSIDAIRGYRRCEVEDLEEGSLFYKKFKRYIEGKNKCYSQGWNNLQLTYNKSPNKYWSRLINKGYPLYYITKGPKNSKLIHPQSGKNTSISADGQILYLSGFAKPVCGLFSPFQLLPEVNMTYDNTRYSISDSDYEIRTSREEHDHSTPLNVYDMANRMIRRAEIYYNKNRYLLAALVAGEAQEVLNGFHHRLMIKAYYIQTVAENAISMDVVGANEQYLTKDAQFRVERIKEDVERFYYGYEENRRCNVLNHIFSTCRKFCKEHEHFESEEVFISAMGHLLEGMSFQKMFKNIIEIINNKFYHEYK